MEYDNDRIRKPTSGLEKFFWVLFVLIYPLINAITLFPLDPGIWPVLLLVNLVLLPAYLLYSRILGPVLLLGSRRGFAVLMSLLSALVIQAFLVAVYSLISKFPLSPEEKSYFSLSPVTLIREGCWSIIYLTLSLALFFMRKAIDEKDKLLTVQQDSVFFKLRYLRTQLNPHFLFNTLNSVYSLSLQKSDQAPEVVIKLADIMRYLIYECNEEKIPLEKEIEFIRNYIEIEKIRHKADIRLTIEGLTSGIMIEPYLFISFIENGFKHAMDHTFGEPFIYITLRVGNGQIVLNVINSTEADLETQAKRINGMGISHSRSMLELLYPDAYDLDIIQTEKDETRTSLLRMRNARERLETLYPDSHTLDVILSKSAFTVSLILKSRIAC
jgi:two-component system, LytTR family, sensor kinase